MVGDVSSFFFLFVVVVVFWCCDGRCILIDDFE